MPLNIFIRYLSPFSILANIIQFVGLGIVFYYLFSSPLPDSRSRAWVAETDRLPLFFGTAIFAIEGICVVRTKRHTPLRLLYLVSDLCKSPSGGVNEEEGGGD